MTIPLSEIQKLEVSAIIELFVIDATEIGAGIYRFHAGTNQLNENIVWQGNTYTRYPIEATGFDVSGSGTLPRPRLVVSNFMSGITALLLTTDDMLGTKLTRKRTLNRYVDAVNFSNGINETADPEAQFPDEIYYIDRKVNENRTAVEFECTSVMDLSGVMLPKRQIIQNSCSWKYRGSECGYTGEACFTKDDQPTTDTSKDSCSKRLASCKLRFGANAELPYGGFPGADLFKGNY